jgi:predicted transcriptional regulator
MKTAVSVPDELFARAEAAARQLHVSRSHLYAIAIAEFLERQQELGVTGRLNEVYARQSSKLDSGLRHAQIKTLEKDTW